MSDALAQIEEVRREAEAALQSVSTPDGAEQFRIQFLGTKGKVKGLMDLLGQVPREQKPEFGQRANAVKREITSAFEAKKAALAQGDGAVAGRDAVDVTEPGRRPEIGNRHILMKVVDELTELFGRMGFSVASGPEVEDDFHNFVALDIPPSHPARDPLDNFYLQTGSPDSPPLLRTQTSTVQIRVMERQRPP